MVALSKIDTMYQFCLQALWNIFAKKGSEATVVSLDAKGTALKGVLAERNHYYAAIAQW